MAQVRFDDLSPGNEQAFELVDLVDIVEAHHPGEVIAALTAVDIACRNGLWAGGFVGYEAAPGLDAALTVHDRSSELPLVWFGLFRRRVDVAALAPQQIRPAAYHISAWRTVMDRSAHAEAIDEIHGAIADGDTYQVNLTFRLTAAFSGDPRALYRDVTIAQRGAHAGFLDMGRHVVASASPEMFFEWRNGTITVRPMKGTMGRGRWAAEDEDRARALLASEKDRAENLMIVDLLRNDLGRIADFGSVRVEELFSLERFETVWHLTSTVSAHTNRGTSLAEVFAALFPSGSITGAPKPSTMRIIADLEQTERGVYCGAVGFVGPPRSGEADPWAKFNVAIRTATIDLEEGTAHYGVGGGITWDSHSHAEYEEARVKALVLGERRPEFALLETMRWEPAGGIVLWAEHESRLVGSARYFGFDLDLAAVREAIEDAVDGALVAQRVRLRVSRSGEIAVGSTPLARPFARGYREDESPIYFCLDDDPVSPDDVFLYHKTTHRSMYDERLKRYPMADDVLMINDRGELTEFTIANLALQLDGKWWTPPQVSGLLDGTYRHSLLERGELRERTLYVDDLHSAQAVAMINSVRGWIPAAQAALRSL